MLMHRMSWAGPVFALAATAALADDLEILVAPRDSDAYATAEAAEQAGTALAERTIVRGLLRATEHLAGCGSCTVRVKIAAGAYDGKAGSGRWSVPDVDAPQGALEITGGWNDAFDDRAPFDDPTILVSARTRGGPVLQFEGRKHAIGRVVVSGLVFDTAASNRYDTESRSLLKGGSSTYAQLSFGYLTTDHLVIADNVFMNAPAGVGGPSLRALSDTTRIDIENNLFFNNVTPWTVPGGASERMPAEIRLAHNSFVLNWPYNPDRTTSNPGALEIGNNYATRHVLIERNLFAFNMGGAIFPQWDEDRGPPITIGENLFWRNGSMFDPTRDDAGAVVGKFAGSPVHAIFSAEDLEDDFDWNVYGNESFDPGLQLDPPELKAVRYGYDYRGADGALEAEEPAAPELDEAIAAELDDLTAQLAALTGGTGAADGAGDGDGDDATDAGVVVLGPDNDIRNYAPELAFGTVGLPFPTRPDAMHFGASRERVWTGAGQ